MGFRSRKRIIGPLLGGGRSPGSAAARRAALRERKTRRRQQQSGIQASCNGLFLSVIIRDATNRLNNPAAPGQDVVRMPMPAHTHHACIHQQSAHRGGGSSSVISRTLDLAQLAAARAAQRVQQQGRA
jgi:hypothetical protein